MNYSITLLREMLVQWWHSNGLGLRRLLSMARELESTDPHDRVYAMLGLASRAYAIKPNYKPRNRPKDVYIRAAKACIVVDHNLDSLCDGNEKQWHMEWELPSWVPDFSVPTNRFTLIDSRKHESEFCAMKGLPIEYGFKPDSNGVKNQILRLKILNWDYRSTARSWGT